MSNAQGTQTSGGAGYCPRCGAAAGAGDRFCRACGASLAGTPAKRLAPGPKGLRALGLAVIALAALFAFFYYGSRGSRDSQPSQPISFGEIGSGEGMGASQPLAPRESADLLFNRAMTAYESGDSAEAGQFVPMALLAYRQLESLDLDARYHIALLSLAANLPRDALAQTDTMLAAVPDHLLALSAAGDAYAQLGDAEAAAKAFRRFLEVYTPEVAVSRPEYLEHARGLPGLRDEARRYLQERGMAPP